MWKICKTFNKYKISIQNQNMKMHRLLRGLITSKYQRKVDGSTNFTINKDTFLHFG